MASLAYEKKLFQDGYNLIAAIDEAGRGPLAGPVVAGCVIIDSKFKSTGKLKQINDSKRLSSAKREELYDLIVEKFPAVGIGVVPNTIIDKINIWQATMLAMAKALETTKIRPDVLIVDGRLFIPKIKIKQFPIIHGDSISLSIAAASIIAKVTRDRLMNNFHKKFPAYGFDKHKGYGTKMHITILGQIGPCSIHRGSFEWRKMPE